ncbi:Uncharacterised protein g10187 [Pycnogonum litorale]
MHQRLLNRLEIWALPTLLLVISIVCIDAMQAMSSTCPHSCVCLSGTQVLCAKVQLREIPVGIPNSAEYVSLSDNYISVVPSGILGKLDQVKRLVLDDNEIVNVEKYAFRGLKNVIELSLRNNPLTVLASYSFSGIDGVQSLYLSSNRIGSIEPNAFHRTNAVTYLSLTDNPLRNIESDGFSGLTNVGYLSLPDNVSRIDADAFNGLVNVTLLKLDGLNAEILSQFTFRGTSGISTVSMTDCKVERFESGTFARLTDVNLINIDGCHVTTIDPFAFSGMKDVRSLQFTNNTVDDIERSSFDGIVDNVNVLNVSGNYFRCDCRYAAMVESFKNHSKVLFARNRCLMDERSFADEFVVNVAEECDDQESIVSMDNYGTGNANANRNHCLLVLIFTFFLSRLLQLDNRQTLLERI